MFPLFALAASAFGAKAMVAGAATALGPGHAAASQILALNKAADLWTLARAAEVVGVPVTDTLLQLLNAPGLRTFFKSDLGKSLARMLSTAGYVALVPICGPQLASVSFALPGVLRGEKYADAYWGETMYRIKYAAHAYLKSSTIDGALEDIDQAGKNLLTSSVTEHMAAAEDGVKEAAIGISLSTAAARLYVHAHFDEFADAIRTPDWYNQQAAAASAASSALLAANVVPTEPAPGFLPAVRMSQIAGVPAPVTASQLAWAYCSESGDDSDLLTIAFSPDEGVAVSEVGYVDTQ